MDDTKLEEKQISDAQEVKAMLESRGWSYVKAKFDEMILDLQNINNIDTTDVANMQIEIRARVLAFKLLYDFLKQDVYGFVEQQEVAQEKLSESTDTGYIVREG
jgi:hypothetical protein